jgi:hypothetical protein
MKKISRFLPFVLTIATLFLSACGGAAATPTRNAVTGKVEPSPVAFIGMVDSISGDQWVINGQTVTVSADVTQNGSFSVGDQVKVEGVVNADGSLTVSNVEVPTPQDVSALPPFGDGNSNSSTGNENSSNENSANENGGNENTANENSSNENSANENGNNENEGNENSSNENEGNENQSNENEGNENESNENEGNENESNENESNENESNGNGGGENESNNND